MPAAKTSKKKTKKKVTKTTRAKTSSKKTSSGKASPKKTGKKTTKRATGKTSTEFGLGEYVVYPMHGVGEIQAIQKQLILGKRKECYALEIGSSKMKVLIPVENARAIGLRAIIQKREVKKVLDLLRKEGVDTEEDWKIRYQNNMNKVKSGSIHSIAEVCRDLYKRAKDKELSLMERRLYESAYNMITNELALARGMSVEEAGNMISEVLA